MNRQPQPADNSSGGQKQKSAIGIPSILVLSLFMGLIAGAGAGKSYIFPVALVSAIILIINRNKIASANTAAQPGKSAQKKISTPEGYYTWPELGRFSCPVAAEPYQNTIQQLVQENAINLNDDSNVKTRILKAHLIPDKSNPFDSDIVCITINGHTVGHLYGKQARSLFQKLDDKKLPDQITVCNALITKRAKVNSHKPGYGVQLDIDIETLD